MRIVLNDTLDAKGVSEPLREAVKALINRLEVVEKEYQHVLEVKEIYQHQLNETEDERDALLARIREMERQEPVAWLHETRRDSDVVTDAVKHVWGKTAVGSMAAYSIPLYTLPGAKGEEK